jgi:1,4-dihydroxy-2-naphthoate octaprenyltransferase
MNVAMWGKALKVIPHVTKEEWVSLDIISRWLIASRSAVLVMTFMSAATAGLMAVRAGQFNFVLWLLLTIGLLMAHATNNLLNDWTDYVKGVDKGNYFRAQYGPQPLEHGLLTQRQLLTYAAVTGAIAVLAGAYLVFLGGTLGFVLLALGAFFVLFYTWPLKYIGLGEIAVLIVWGPLMIGGGYYVITHVWDWSVVWAGLPYALGPTTVIFGKHIDKLAADKAKKIYTLPVIIGDVAARNTAVVLFILQYVITVAMVITGFFTPAMLLVLVSLRNLPQTLKIYSQPKPAERPDFYPAERWPLWFVAFAFIQTKRFGLWFMIGLVLDVILKLTILS